MLSEIKTDQWLVSPELVTFVHLFGDTSNRPGGRRSRGRYEIRVGFVGGHVEHFPFTGRDRQARALSEYHRLWQIIDAGKKAGARLPKRKAMTEKIRTIYHDQIVHNADTMDNLIAEHVKTIDAQATEIDELQDTLEEKNAAIAEFEKQLEEAAEERRMLRQRLRGAASRAHVVAEQKDEPLQAALDHLKEHYVRHKLPAQPQGHAYAAIMIRSSVNNIVDKLSSGNEASSYIRSRCHWELRRIAIIALTGILKLNKG